MPNSQPIKLALLMTGDELMSGDITDSNSAYLGGFFSQLQIDIAEKVTVGDKLEQLIAQIQRLSVQYDVLFINGGLGPTEDDLTAKALAAAKQETIVRHQQAEQHVRDWCAARDLRISQANLKQADLPQSALIFPNAPGSACAFHLTIDTCLVIATPGVPSELFHICQHQLQAFLQKKLAVQHYSPWQRFQLFGIGESSLQETINQQYTHLAGDYDIGFRANFPYLELKLRAKKPQQINSSQQTLLLHSLNDKYLGDGHFTLASSLVALLQQRGETLASAESCTGGLIASEITKIAGSSAVYPGSIISYSNTVKEQLLGVSSISLKQHGAVSAAVAKEMLDGCLQRIDASYGIAVTGIAGPDGGSQEKPVGTVFIAFGSREDQHIIKLCIPLARHSFQSMVCAIALDLLRRKISKHSLKPRYLSRWHGEYCQ